MSISRTQSNSSRPKSKYPAGIPGFRVPPRPQQRPIEELTLRELRDRHDRNARILRQPAPSTSTYIPRLQAEQSRIESRLLDLEGIHDLGDVLKHSNIRNDDDMTVDYATIPDPPPIARMAEAKREILRSKIVMHDDTGFTMAQAMQLEAEAEMRDRERKQAVLEKRLRSGMPGKDEVLTRREREARMWAFMNAKPTDSDLEDDEEDDEEEDDPSGWFEDDQDDGRKGQNLVQPDFEEPDIDPNLIRIDYGRIFEMRDGPGA